MDLLHDVAALCRNFYYQIGSFDSFQMKMVTPRGFVPGTQKQVATPLHNTPTNEADRPSTALTVDGFFCALNPISAFNFSGQEQN